MKTFAIIFAASIDIIVAVALLLGITTLASNWELLNAKSIVLTIVFIVAMVTFAIAYTRQTIKENKQ